MIISCFWVESKTRAYPLSTTGQGQRIDDLQLTVLITQTDWEVFEELYSMRSRIASRAQ
jgi:hypothetical protein